MTEASARIVVGIDDSAAARRALRWAAEEARVRGAELWMVHAYAYPHAVGWHTVPLGERPEIYERAVDEMLAQVEREELGLHPGLDVRRLALVGLVPEVLRDVSRQAELLVVGAKSGRHLRRAIYGSVARAVERRCPAPVVVVPADGGVDAGPPLAS